MGDSPDHSGDSTAAILFDFERWYSRWHGTPQGAPPGLREEYSSLCATIGRQVRVELHGERTLYGTAVGVGESGQLLVRPAPGTDLAGWPGADALVETGLVALSAGDVIHLR